MRLFLADLPVSRGFFILGSISPVFVGAGVGNGCEHCHYHKEEERFTRDCSAGSPCLFLCILEHIYILGDPLYFDVIALHFIMQCQEVEGVATIAPRLEVGKERLWSYIGVERLWVPEFLHPCILDDNEDKLRSLAPHRLVGAAVGALGLVSRFRQCTDNGHGIFIYSRVIVSDMFWFGKLRAIAHCLRYHRPNEADKVVGAFHLVLWDLEEERRQDLSDLREVSV